MASVNNSSDTQEMIKEHIRSQPPSSTIPIQVQGPSTRPRLRPEPRTQNLFIQNLFRNIFYIQFVLISILIVYLFVRSLTSAQAHHQFQPNRFYPPLLTSVACAAIISIMWHFLNRLSPSRTVKAAFWLGPLLTCALGFLLIAIGSAPSLALGTIAIVSTVIESLYSCWVSPRFDHTIRIFSICSTSPPKKTTTIVILTIAASTIYSAFIVIGIGGATAIKTIFDSISIFLILLSLAWTMHTTKNTLQVAFSRVKYFHFAYNADFDTIVALHDTTHHCVGSICIGSILIPILGLVRGSARTVSLVSGDTDEFMFSCANCYSGVASRLIMCGNRWGFVYVGLYDEGFVRASSDTWEMFRRVGLQPLIDSDLTSSFCFFSGVAVGSVCAIVGGSWDLLVRRQYATEVCIYAFLIGYFTCRIAMAWLQGSVSAYHVAYAENPQSNLYDSTIPDRIRELERSNQAANANSPNRVLEVARATSLLS